MSEPSTYPILYISIRQYVAVPRAEVGWGGGGDGEVVVGFFIRGFFSGLLVNTSVPFPPHMAHLSGANTRYVQYANPKRDNSFFSDYSHTLRFNLYLYTYDTANT